MKKLFLLLAAGSTALVASAQQNQSVMLNHRTVGEYPGVNNKQVTMAHASHTANKNTSGGSSWFSFDNAHDYSIANDAFLPNVPDTILKVYAATPAFFWWCHGLGTSFDPTSLWFTSMWANGNLNPPSIVVTKNDAYSIDSVEIAGYYRRYKTNLSAPDTLYVDFVAATGATGSGTTLAHWHGGLMAGQESFDTFVRAANPAYDYINNTLAVTGMVRVTKILDAAAFIDTNDQGFHDWVMPLPTALSVPAGGKVIAYTHFASTQTQAYNAAPAPTPVDLDSVNYWESLTWDLAVAPYQGALSPADTNDFNVGLVATSDERANTTHALHLSAGVVTLVPTYFFSAPTYVHDPYYNMHLVCPTCGLSGVNNLNNILNSNAYPNPATAEVYVPFNLNKSANVTVTLVNTLGQVVATQNMGNVVNGKATFNTAVLPAGVYFYNVIANGEHATGRVVVAH
jgi:hypothetical protein